MNKKMYLVPIALIAAIAFTFAVTFRSVSAATYSATQGTDNASVSVTIGQITMIDISPNFLDFGTTYPGNIITKYQDPSVTYPFYLDQFQLENIGSTNITYVWLNVTQPTTNPFGTGNPAAYNPGNWIMVNLTEMPPGYTIPTMPMSYVDRVEFNTSQPIVYLKLPGNTVSYGRFRVGADEFFWAINVTNKSASPLCEPSAAQNNIVYITFSNPAQPHTQNVTGDINLADSNDVVMNITGVNTAGTWAFASKPFIYDGQEYVLFVSTDCKEVRLVAWNHDFIANNGASAVAAQMPNTGYVFNSTLEKGKLTPGASIAMKVQMAVPYGVPYDTYKGVLTVIAEST